MDVLAVPVDQPPSRSAARAAGIPAPGGVTRHLAAVPDDDRWEESVAREIEHQGRIEAAFDRADAYERLGDLERGLVWLARADALSGGLSPTCRAQRTRWARELAEQRMPAAGV